MAVTIMAVTTAGSFKDSPTEAEMVLHCSAAKAKPKETIILKA